MSRRWLLRAVLLLCVLLAGALLSPEVRWWLWGHMRGEAMYRGKPTSYWRGQVLAWNDLGFYPPAVSLVARRPRWWADYPPWRSGRPAPLAEADPFPGNDPAAIPVLVELLRDEDPEVRAGAAEALARTGLAARVAVPALRKALVDADEDVRRRAAEAMRQVDSWAAAEAGVP